IPWPAWINVCKRFKHWKPPSVSPEPRPLSDATVADTRLEAVRQDRAAELKPIAEEMGAVERLNGCTPDRKFTRQLAASTLTSIFPRWTSGFRCSFSTVRIKALQANEIPRFQMNSVRNSAGRQTPLRWTSPLDVKPGAITWLRIPELGVLRTPMRKRCEVKRRDGTRSSRVGNHSYDRRQTRSAVFLNDSGVGSCSP